MLRVPRGRSLEAITAGPIAYAGTYARGWHLPAGVGGAPGGIRTPDHLIRSPLPVGTLPKGRFVRGTALPAAPIWSIPG